MKIHLFSKGSGVLQVNEGLPNEPFDHAIPGAKFSHATWSDARLIIQGKHTPENSIYLIDIESKQQDELQVLIAAPYNALVISLQASTIFELPGFRDQQVIHERSFNIYGGPRLELTARIRYNHQRLAVIPFFGEQLRESLSHHQRSGPFLLSHLAGETARLAKHPNIAPPVVLEKIRRIIRCQNPRCATGWISSVKTWCMNALLEPSLRPPAMLPQETIDKLYIAKALVTSQPHNNITLEQISAHSGLTKYQIANLFQKVFGLTFRDYVTAFKMEIAANLLLESRDNKLDVIAEKLGYFSASTFTRAFKAHFELLPMEYVHEMRRKLCA